MSLGINRMGRRGTGSLLSPVRGRLVRCMARGAMFGCRRQFTGVSRNALIRSSMNPSTLPPALVGAMCTVIRRA